MKKHFSTKIINGLGIFSLNGPNKDKQFVLKNVEESLETWRKSFLRSEPGTLPELIRYLPARKAWRSESSAFLVSCAILLAHEAREAEFVGDEWSADMKLEELSFVIKELIRRHDKKCVPQKKSTRNTKTKG